MSDGEGPPGASRYCRACGEPIDAEADFCPGCGADQAELPAGGGESRAADEKYCAACGTVIDRSAERCPSCEEKQPVQATANLDRVTAAILAIVLGGIGAHKFYLGETTTGVVYLCFVWTLVPVFLGIIEGVIYLTTSDEEFQRKYVATAAEES